MKIITQFTLNTEDYEMSIIQMFKILGYKKHNTTWIKKDENGRFHAVQIKREVNVHYDVNTLEGRHMTLPSVETLQREKKRMLNYIKKQKKY